MAKLLVAMWKRYCTLTSAADEDVEDAAVAIDNIDKDVAVDFDAGEIHLDMFDAARDIRNGASTNVVVTVGDKLLISGNCGEATVVSISVCRLLDVL